MLRWLIYQYLKQSRLITIMYTSARILQILFVFPNGGSGSRSTDIGSVFVRFFIRVFITASFSDATEISPNALLCAKNGKLESAYFLDVKGMLDSFNEEITVRKSSSVSNR